MVIDMLKKIFVLIILLMMSRAEAGSWQPVIKVGLLSGVKQVSLKVSAPCVMINAAKGNILRKIEQKNGLKPVSCHGLRHTYCSLLLSQNVPIQTVSKYMGHSDSTVTLKVYSHFIPDTQDKALNALNRLAVYYLKSV